MKNRSGWDIAATILLIIGGLNWGLIGAFNVEVIGTIFNGSNGYDNGMSVLTRLIYILIGLAAIYCIVGWARARRSR